MDVEFVKTDKGVVIIEDSSLVFEVGFSFYFSFLMDDNLMTIAPLTYRLF